MFGDNKTVENSGSNAKPGRVTNAEGKNNNLLRFGGLIATALFVLVGTACFFQSVGAGSQIVRKLSVEGGAGAGCPIISLEQCPPRGPPPPPECEEYCALHPHKVFINLFDTKASAWNYALQNRPESKNIYGMELDLFLIEKKTREDFYDLFATPDEAIEYYNQEKCTSYQHCTAKKTFENLFLKREDASDFEGRPECVSYKICSEYKTYADALEAAQQTYDSARTTYNNAIAAAKQTYENADETYKNAIAAAEKTYVNADTTLQNAKKTAESNYNQATKEQQQKKTFVHPSFDTLYGTGKKLEEKSAIMSFHEMFLYDQPEVLINDCWNNGGSVENCAVQSIENLNK